MGGTGPIALCWWPSAHGELDPHFTHYLSEMGAVNRSEDLLHKDITYLSHHFSSSFPPPSAI